MGNGAPRLGKRLRLGIEIGSHWPRGLVKDVKLDKVFEGGSAVTANPLASNSNLLSPPQIKWECIGLRIREAYSPGEGLQKPGPPRLGLSLALACSSSQLSFQLVFIFFCRWTPCGRAWMLPPAPEPHPLSFITPESDHQAREGLQLSLVGAHSWL